MKNKSELLIAKNTLMLYIRMVLVMAINLYASRIILQALGIVDYGIYNAVGGVVLLFSFLSGPMISATRRFLNVELGSNNIERATLVFSTSILIHALFSIIIILIAESVGLWMLFNKLNFPYDRVHAAFWVFQFSLFGLIIKMFTTPYNADIIANEKMEAFAYISIAEVLLNLLIVYVLMLTSFDRLVLYAFLLFVIQLVVLIIYYLYCRKQFKESSFTFIINKQLFVEMLSFIGWTMTGGVSTIFSNQGINIILNVFFGPIINAAMAISSQVQAGVTLLCSNFQTAVAPQLTRSYVQKEYEEMHHMLILSSKFSFFLILLMSVPIIMEVDIILRTWLIEVPEHTSNFLRIALLISLVTSLANPLILSIHAVGSIRKFQVVVESIQSSVILCSYLYLKVVPEAKPESVLIVCLAIALLAQYARIRIVLPSIHMKMSCYFNRVVKSCIFVLFISPLLPLSFYLYGGFNGWGRFFIIVFTSILSTSLTAFYIGCTKHERDVISNLTKRSLHKIKHYL